MNSWGKLDFHLIVFVLFIYELLSVHIKLLYSRTLSTCLFDLAGLLLSYSNIFRSNFSFCKMQIMFIDGDFCSLPVVFMFFPSLNCFSIWAHGIQKWLLHLCLWSFQLPFSYSVTSLEQGFIVHTHEFNSCPRCHGTMVDVETYFREENHLLIFKKIFFRSVLQRQRHTTMDVTVGIAIHSKY